MNQKGEEEDKRRKEGEKGMTCIIIYKPHKGYV